MAQLSQDAEPAATVAEKDEQLLPSKRPLDEAATFSNTDPTDIGTNFNIQHDRESDEKIDDAGLQDVSVISSVENPISGFAVTPLQTELSAQNDAVNSQMETDADSPLLNNIEKTGETENPVEFLENERTNPISMGEAEKENISAFDEVMLDVPQQVEEQLDYGYDDEEDDNRIVKKGNDNDEDSVTVVDGQTEILDEVPQSATKLGQINNSLDDDDDIDSFVVFDEAVSAVLMEDTAGTDRLSQHGHFTHSEGRSVASVILVAGDQPEAAVAESGEHSATGEEKNVLEDGVVADKVASAASKEQLSDETTVAKHAEQFNVGKEADAHPILLANSTEFDQTSSSTLDQTDTQRSVSQETGQATVEKSNGAETSSTSDVVPRQATEPAFKLLSGPVEATTGGSTTNAASADMSDLRNDAASDGAAASDDAADKTATVDAASTLAVAESGKKEQDASATDTDGGQANVTAAVDDTASSQPSGGSPARARTASSSSAKHRSVSPKKARIEWTIGKDGKLQEKPVSSVDGATSKEDEPKKEYLLRFRNMTDNVQALEFKDFVAQHIQVLTCRLLKGKKSQINALISVPDHGAVEKGINVLNGVEYKGQALGVSEFPCAFNNLEQHIGKTDAEKVEKSADATAGRRSSPEKRSEHRKSSSPRKRTPPRSSPGPYKSRSRRLSIKRGLPSSTSARNNERRRSRSPPSSRLRDGRGGRSRSRDRRSSPRRRAISPPRRIDSGRNGDSKQRSNGSDRRGGRSSRSRSPPSSARYTSDGRFDRDRLGQRKETSGADVRRRAGGSPPPTSLRTADLASRQAARMHQHHVGPPGLSSRRPEFGADGRRTNNRLAASPPPSLQSRIGPPSALSRGPPLPAVVQQNNLARSRNRSPSPHRRIGSGVAAAMNDLRPQLRARREHTQEDERLRLKRERAIADADVEIEKMAAERRQLAQENEEKLLIQAKMERLLQEKEALEREKRKKVDSERRILEVRDLLAGDGSTLTSLRPAFPAPGVGSVAHQQYSQHQLQAVLLAQQQQQLHLEQQRKANEYAVRSTVAQQMPVQQHADYNGRYNEVRVVERDVGNMQRQQPNNTYGTRAGASQSRGDDRRRDDGSVSKYADSSSSSRNNVGAAKRPHEPQAQGHRGYDHNHTGNRDQPAKSRRENSPPAVPQLAASQSLGMYRMPQQQQQPQRSNYDNYTSHTNSVPLTKQPMNLGSSSSRDAQNVDILRQSRQAAAATAATGRNVAGNPAYNMMPQQQQSSNASYANAYSYAGSTAHQAAGSRTANDPSAMFASTARTSNGNPDASAVAYQQALATYQQQQQQYQARMASASAAPSATASRSAGGYGGQQQSASSAVGFGDARLQLQQQQYRDASQMAAGRGAGAGSNAAARGGAQYGSGRADPNAAAAYANNGVRQQPQARDSGYWRP